jgi:hypothetical protein
MVALSAGWETKGTEATVGQRYEDPFAATPDVNGNMSVSDAVVLDGPDPTISKQVFNPPMH